MKALFSILLVLTVIAARSQSVFNFKKDMVWIENAKLFVCKYEVTNVEYREFTDELLRDTINQRHAELIYEMFYPDTMVWIRDFQYGMGDALYPIYRWHPAFNGHPVVGVRYEGALKYCEWLTKKYGKGKYKFRLPTKVEFIKYAKVGSFPLAGGLENPRNDKRQYLVNYKPNKTNLDDSLSRVYYNSQNNTFVRVYDDTTTTPIDESVYNIPDAYTYYVENYLNGYLYLGVYRDFLKLKVPDSLTYYDQKTNSYTKEKLVLHVKPNYWVDGYMYSSPTRGTKRNTDLGLFNDEGKIKNDLDFKLIYNKSSFPPDKNGLYDLAGNVSEIVSEKGLAMGGNWNSTANELNYDSEYDIDKGYDVLIGFRIVAEPIE
jgi:formylglycine-generating enzyme required for sulfatase activity